jgi:hypothetical protein
MYIARIDTPFMAPGVGVFGPVHVDGYPLAFRKDVLLSEAHRNVYLERLGLLFLLKLRCGDRFGSRAGGAWRLLYVLCLMPWLRKYRSSPTSSGDPVDLRPIEDEEDENITMGTGRRRSLAAGLDYLGPEFPITAAASAESRGYDMIGAVSVRRIDDLKDENQRLKQAVQVLMSRINAGKQNNMAENVVDMNVDFGEKTEI